MHTGERKQSDKDHKNTVSSSTTASTDTNANTAAIVPEIAADSKSFIYVTQFSLDEKELVKLDDKNIEFIIFSGRWLIGLQQASGQFDSRYFVIDLDKKNIKSFIPNNDKNRCVIPVSNDLFAIVRLKGGIHSLFSSSNQILANICICHPKDFHAEPNMEQGFDMVVHDLNYIQITPVPQQEDCFIVNPGPIINNFFDNDLSIPFTYINVKKIKQEVILTYEARQNAKIFFNSKNELIVYRIENKANYMEEVFIIDKYQLNFNAPKVKETKKLIASFKSLPVPNHFMPHKFFRSSPINDNNYLTETSLLQVTGNHLEVLGLYPYNNRIKYISWLPDGSALAISGGYPKRIIFLRTIIKYGKAETEILIDFTGNDRLFAVDKINGRFVSIDRKSGICSVYTVPCILAYNARVLANTKAVGPQLQVANEIFVALPFISRELTHLIAVYLVTAPLDFNENIFHDVYHLRDSLEEKIQPQSMKRHSVNKLEDLDEPTKQFLALDMFIRILQSDKHKLSDAVTKILTEPAFAQPFRVITHDIKELQAEIKKVDAKISADAKKNLIAALPMCTRKQ